MTNERGITGAGIGIMVLQNDKVLLGLRHYDPNKADGELHGENTWTMPGGKIHFGETFEEAAARELTEETSLIGADFTVITLTNDRVPDAQFVTIGLLCQKFSGDVKIMEPDEIVEWHWFGLNNLPQNLFLPSRKIIELYQTGKFYSPLYENTASRQ